MHSPDYSPSKFKGLILYAAHRARETEDQWFGAVKLNKILYFSDFISYQRQGRSITGATYQKLSEGPAPRELLQARDQLIGDELARINPTQVFNYVQHRLVPTANEIDPADYFDATEAQIIDEVIDALSSMTAAQVSELSHNEMGWRIADMHETIPYETALLAPWPQESEISAQGND